MPPTRRVTERPRTDHRGSSDTLPHRTDAAARAGVPFGAAPAHGHVPWHTVIPPGRDTGLTVGVPRRETRQDGRRHSHGVVHVAVGRLAPCFLPVGVGRGRPSRPVWAGQARRVSVRSAVGSPPTVPRSPLPGRRPGR